MTRKWQGRRVLVTGATGMTGSFLAEKMLSLGAKVRIPLRSDNWRSLAHRRGEIEIVKGDLTDNHCCAALVDDVDEVFHLASCRRNVAFNHEHSGLVSQANVSMIMALLRSLKSRPEVPVTFFSSANLPATLDPLLLRDQKSIDGYVVGKYTGELLWMAAAKERGFPLLIVRPVGIYGPRDTFSMDGNVIPSLIVKAREGGEHLVIWGSGEQERAFLYVEDIVGALLRLLDHDVQGIQFVTPPEFTTIRDVATRIRDLVQPALPLFFDTSRQAGAPRLQQWPVHACLADYPWTPFADGLERTVNWWTESA